jgi:hypothetical protein
MGMMLLLDAYHLTLHGLSAMLLSSSSFVFLAFAQLVVFGAFSLRLFMTVWNADSWLRPVVRRMSGGYVRLYMWVRSRKDKFFFF